MTWKHLKCTDEKMILWIGFVMNVRMNKLEKFVLFYFVLLEYVVLIISFNVLIAGLVHNIMYYGFFTYVIST